MKGGACRRLCILTLRLHWIQSRARRGRFPARRQALQSHAHRCPMAVGAASAASWDASKAVLSSRADYLRPLRTSITASTAFPAFSFNYMKNFTCSFPCNYLIIFNDGHKNLTFLCTKYFTFLNQKFYFFKPNFFLFYARISVRNKLKN